MQLNAPRSLKVGEGEHTMTPGQVNQDIEYFQICGWRGGLLFSTVASQQNMQSVAN